MPRLSETEILRRAKKAWTDKELYRDILTRAYALTQPEKDTQIRRTKGELLNDGIFANTLQRSHFNFANRMQSDLTPPLQKWMQLKVGPRIPKQFKEELQRDLSDLRELFFAVVAGSNFDTAAHEHYLELGLLNAATLVLPSDDPARDIEFVTAPQSEYALEAGAWGKTIGVYRKFTIRAQDIKMHWSDAFEGKDASKPFDWEARNESSPDRKIELDEVMYWGFPDSKEVWYYDVIVREGNSKMTRVVAREFPENQWIISRWSRSPGEAYGRGPVLLALADAQVQNAVYRLLLMNASLAVQGIYTGVDDGVFNPHTVQFRPGAIIPVGSNAGGSSGPSLQPLTPAYDLDLSQFILDDLDIRIKKAMLDEGLPPDTAAVRSATEIMQRSRELQRSSESPFARLHQEWIRPVTQVTLNTILRKGVSGFEDLQQRGIRIDGQIVDVQVTSALAQSQQLSELDSFVKLAELSNALFGPEVTQRGMKVEDSVKFMGERLGVDPNLIRDEQEKMLLQAEELAARQRAAIEEAQREGVPEQRSPAVA